MYATASWTKTASKRPPEPQRAHVAEHVVALGVQLPAQRQHLRREVRQRAREVIASGARRCCRRPSPARAASRVRKRLDDQPRGNARPRRRSPRVPSEDGTRAQGRRRGARIRLSRSRSKTTSAASPTKAAPSGDSARRTPRARPLRGDPRRGCRRAWEPRATDKEGRRPRLANDRHQRFRRVDRERDETAPSGSRRTGAGS